MFCVCVVLSCIHCATVEIQYGCSQVFLAVNPERYGDTEAIREKVREAAAYFKASEPAENDSDIHIPGEGLERFHRDHDENGIFVDDGVWESILAL